MMTSDFLEEDIASGEVRLVSLAAFKTGIWAIAETLDPRSDDDKFRAYPDQNFSNNIGLIYASGNSRKQVLDQARSWS